jgi:hypothetical protein
MCPSPQRGRGALVVPVCRTGLEFAQRIQCGKRLQRTVGANGVGQRLFGTCNPFHRRTRLWYRLESLANLVCWRL